MLMYKITRLLFVSLFIFPVLTATGQVKIGDNPTQIHPKALLELESTTQMLLLPRLTNEQRDQALPIADTPAGAVIFNTTSGMLEVLHLAESPTSREMIKTWTPMDISHTDVGETESIPQNPKLGDTFYDTETNQMMVYGDDEWYTVQTYSQSEMPEGTTQLPLIFNEQTGVLQLGDSSVNLQNWLDDQLITDTSWTTILRGVGVPEASQLNANSLYIDTNTDTLYALVNGQVKPLAGSSTANDNQELTYDDTDNQLSIEGGNEVDLSELDDVFLFTGTPQPSDIATGTIVINEEGEIFTKDEDGNIVTPAVPIECRHRFWSMYFSNPRWPPLSFFHHNSTHTFGYSFLQRLGFRGSECHQHGFCYRWQ